MKLVVLCCVVYVKLTGRDGRLMENMQVNSKRGELHSGFAKLCLC